MYPRMFPNLHHHQQTFLNSNYAPKGKDFLQLDPYDV